MSSKKDKKDITREGISSIRAEYISRNKGDMSDIPMTQVFFLKGKKNSSTYKSKELLSMLEEGDLHETYEALGAIGKLKLKDALNQLKYMALYDDDLSLQEESVRTIRRIGGKKALDILDFLKTTEHKELINMILKHGADYGVISYEYED
jgi:hypothetical protein